MASLAAFIVEPNIAANQVYVAQVEALLRQGGGTSKPKQRQP